MKYSWKQLEKDTSKLGFMIMADGFMPDTILGIGRDGAVVATMLSYLFDRPTVTIDISNRFNTFESNLWVPDELMEDETKTALIVTALNVTGATLTWIRNDWMAGCLPDDRRWDRMWDEQIKIASLFSNETSAVDVDYCRNYFNVHNKSKKFKIKFPWETLSL